MRGKTGSIPYPDAALYTEVDLGPGHIVPDGVPAPAKGAQQPPPLFGPCLLWPRSPISTTAELLFSKVTMMTIVSFVQ